MFNLMLSIMGWLAEEESNKKSERVKAVRTEQEGQTFSKYGKKWGRKSIDNKRLIEEIKSLKEKGLSIREITKQVFYYDKNNNKINPSVSFVFKVIRSKMP